MRNMLVLVLLVLVGSVLADVEKKYKFPVPAGEHPRILFTKKDLPELRKKAATPMGKQLLYWLKHKGHGGSGEIAKAITAGNEKKLSRWTKSIANQWDSFANRARCAALYYQITGEAKAGRVAAGMFRVWLKSWKPSDNKKRNSWGSAEWALTYDWVYDQLTSVERKKAEGIFAVMVGTRAIDTTKNAWYMEKIMPTGRQTSGCNWTVLCMSNLALTNMALEGKKGYNPELRDKCLKICRRYLENSISPNGAMFEGMNYSMTDFGTQHLPLYLIALRNRGYDFYKQSNLKKIPYWIAYETLPWGFESFNTNKSSGFYSPAALPSFIGKELGKPGKYLYNQALGIGANITPNSTVALINGWPENTAAEKRDKFPLSKWFSVKGSVFCRSGWGSEDVMLNVNTNPIRAGHSHADHGSFCIAGFGAYLISDSGPSCYNSKYHNIVHIDGKAINQYGEGGNESFIRSVELSPYADIIDIDLKPAYDKYLFDKSGKYTFKGPWTWKPYNPVKYADRRFMFIRGVSGTIIVVADHIKKDNKVRSYNWLARTIANNILKKTKRGFKITERFGGPVISTLQKGKKAIFERNNIPNGIYHGWLLVRGMPCPRSWASNNLTVNGVKVPYNEAYFGRGNHRAGWRWLPIRPQRKNDIPVKDGNLKLEIKSYSGALVALAVFTRDKNWQPEGLIPRNNDKFIVVAMNDAVSNDWDQITMSKGMLEAKFLGKAPSIKISQDKKTKCRVIDAQYRAKQADFLAVMLSTAVDSGRKIEFTDAPDKQSVMIKSPNGVDYIAGAVNGMTSRGQVKTDAAICSVSLKNDKIIGYGVVNAKKTRFKDTLLVKASAPVDLINDGRQIILRGPGGTTVECYGMNADKLVCNGQVKTIKSSRQLKITIPALATKWDIKIIDKGKKVIVAGNGKLPLRIKAPQANECIVNGVSRYFTRDWSGYIYPVLKNGTVLIQPSGYPNYIRKK